MNSSVGLVVLDRDGVVNELWRDSDLGLVDSPLRPDQVIVTTDAATAIARVNECGVPVAVASNQPAAAKGKTSRANLDAVTSEIARQLRRHGARIDRFFYCLHHPDATVPELRAVCECRKPRPGLLLEACETFGVTTSRTWFVGDTTVDVRAGQAAGVRTAWIGTPRCDACPGRNAEEPDLTAPDLTSVVDRILKGS